MTKTCDGCGATKDEKKFKIIRRSGPIVYRRRTCKPCDRQVHPDRFKRESEVSSRRQRAERRDPAYRAKWIWIDCRKSDRRDGYPASDLTRVEIEAWLSGGCAYCGETAVLQLTLDRRDNSVGHQRSNVVVACRRCNLTRSDMPYEAWLVVAKAMRICRERGLFGEWQPKRTHPNGDVGELVKPQVC